MSEIGQRIKTRDNQSKTSLWKIISRCIPSKERKIQCYSKDSEQIANEFNQFFIAVGEKTANAAAQVALDNNLNAPTSSSFPAMSCAMLHTPRMKCFTYLPFRVLILNESSCLYICLQTKHQDRTKLV
jgi:hypothetical protein